MKPSILAIAAILTLAAPGAHAAESATEAANKALVLKFWSVVFDSHDVSKASDFLAPEYTQHNPNVPTGRQAFLDYFGKIFPRPLAPADVKATKFDAVLADGDLVQLMFMQPKPEPADASKTYKSYWFDLFRVKNGKIVEHWDGALKPPPGAPPRL